MPAFIRDQDVQIFMDFIKVGCATVIVQRINIYQFGIKLLIFEKTKAKDKAPIDVKIQANILIVPIFAEPIVASLVIFAVVVPIVLNEPVKAVTKGVSNLSPATICPVLIS